jgi:DNA-binding transcriptional MerR regulator
MRISELADTTGVPVATIKFYLREKLLPSGRLTSRTSAVYDESHVDRVRLIRALTDAGGLNIAAVRRIVDALDSPHQEQIDMLGIAQRTLAGETAEDAETAAADEDAARFAPGRISSRVRALAERRGWSVLERSDPLMTRLEQAWSACDQARVPTGDDHIDAYAEAMSLVARADIAHMPRSTAEAMRMVVVGTVMSRGLLDVLRMIEQREAAIAHAKGRGPEQETGRGPAQNT